MWLKNEFVVHTEEHIYIYILYEQIQIQNLNIKTIFNTFKIMSQHINIERHKRRLTCILLICYFVKNIGDLKLLKVVCYYNVVLDWLLSSTR